MKPLLFLLLSLLPLQGQSTGAAAEFSRKANQWMASTDGAKRQAAYRSWLQMGPDAMPEFEKSLEASRKYHDKAIDKLCSDANPYLEHEDLARELDTERERIIPLIRTDWKKKGSKIEMLRDDMEGLARLNERIGRVIKSDTAAFDQAFESHFDALTEIARQLERFDSDADTIGMEDDDIREQLIKQHIEGSHMQELRARFMKSRDDAALLVSTNEANEKVGKWASGPMVSFAEMLNVGRDLLGLRPMKLEEKLSAAAEGHSADMVRLGFFAHESPVPNKRTPWDRAKMAEFEGQANGENIYMGSGNPQAAYDAWFASDGHRFIMMAAGPNVVGVGISGNHWTMMTGNL